MAEFDTNNHYYYIRREGDIQLTSRIPKAYYFSVTPYYLKLFYDK